MDYGAFELSWVGASGGCTDLPMNNHAVVAGTRLRVGLRHLKTAKDHRPEEIYIFAAYDKLLSRVLARITASPHGARLERLDLKPAGMSDFVSATDPWPLKPPPSIKGRLEVYCSFEPDGSHRGPALTSLAYQTVEHSGTEGPKDVKGSVDIKGIGPKIELTGGGSATTTFTAVAALDPQLYVDALIPGDGEFEEFLYDYIDYVANTAGLKAKDVHGAFLTEYAGMTDRSWAKRLKVHFEPEFFEVGAGQPKVIQLRLSRPRLYSQPALLVIRVRDTSDRALVTLSDFIVVDDDLSTFQIDSDGDGTAIRVERQ